MSHLSLYQIIHTLDGEIYHLEEHLKLLFEAYFELYSGCAKLPPKRIRSEIERVISASRCPRGVSLFVKIVVSRTGDHSIVEHERSLYRGYTLRCISPRVALVKYTIPHISLPTLLREQMTQYVNFEASKSRADLALRINGGEVDLINGAQIFAMNESELITSPTSHSVEHALAKACAIELGVTLVERAIKSSELNGFEELFFVDHYGVTAIRSYKERYYMSLTANSIANAMATLVTPIL